MAYAASNSSSPNAPALVQQSLAYSSSNVTGVAGFSKGLPRTWQYCSTHGATEVVAANFFTDGLSLGMKVGDMLMNYGSSGAVTIHRVLTVGSTTTQVGIGTVIATTV